MVLLPCRSSCATHPPGKLSNALQLKIKFACRPYGGSGSGAACLNVMFALGYVASSQRITRTSHCRSALLVSPSWQVPTIRWHATRALDSGRHQPIGSMRHARTSTCYTPPSATTLMGSPVTRVLSGRCSAAGPVYNSARPPRTATWQERAPTHTCPQLLKQLSELARVSSVANAPFQNEIRQCELLGKDLLYL